MEAPNSCDHATLIAPTAPPRRGGDQGSGLFARRTGLLQGAVSADPATTPPARRDESRPMTRFPLGRVSTRQSCGPCVVVNPERPSALRCHAGRRRPDVPRQFTPARPPTRIGHCVSFGVRDARVRDSTLRSIVIGKWGQVTFRRPRLRKAAWL
jgi:hypothetical protein